MIPEGTTFRAGTTDLTFTVLRVMPRKRLAQVVGPSGIRRWRPLDEIEGYLPRLVCLGAECPDLQQGQPQCWRCVRREG